MSLPLGSSLPGSWRPKHDTYAHMFLEFCSWMAKQELESSLVLFHSLKSRKKPPLDISSPTHSISHISLATKGHRTFLPGMVISPSCFHSTLLQFTLISLQQFRDTGLLSHVTFVSSLSKIRMGVTLIFFLDSYSKISTVSLQIYSPAWNTWKHSLLWVDCYWYLEWQPRGLCHDSALRNILFKRIWDLV